jgi:hypothetical protein
MEEEIIWKPGGREVKAEVKGNSEWAVRKGPSESRRYHLLPGLLPLLVTFTTAFSAAAVTAFPVNVW